jgi:hypothetical protein
VLIGNELSSSDREKTARRPMAGELREKTPSSSFLGTKEVLGLKLSEE